jgi:hypothetical protein
VKEAKVILDQAHTMLANFKALAEDEPDRVDSWAAVIHSYGTEADGWAFALRKTKEPGPLALRPYVMFVTPLGLIFIDPATDKVMRRLSWSYFCTLEDTRLTELTIIYFPWYVADGMTVEERLKDQSPIRRDECEGWALLSDVTEALIADIAEYVRIAGVPADRYDDMSAT